MARRTFTVVGRLCDSREEALGRLKAIRNQMVPEEGIMWGLVKIQKKAGTLRLPLPPAILQQLDELLSDPEIRKTKPGRAARQLVRAAQRTRC